MYIVSILADLEVTSRFIHFLKQGSLITNFLCVQSRMIYMKWKLLYSIVTLSYVSSFKHSFLPPEFKTNKQMLTRRCNIVMAWFCVMPCQGSAVLHWPRFSKLLQHVANMKHVSTSLKLSVLTTLTIRICWSIMLPAESGFLWATASLQPRMSRSVIKSMDPLARTVKVTTLAKHIQSTAIARIHSKSVIPTSDSWWICNNKIFCLFKLWKFAMAVFFRKMDSV